MSKQSAILNLYIEQITEEPTNTTIMNWVKKLGLYQLNKPKEKSGDWIILLDHSIQLGQEKLFVVMGIRESEINFNRPLQYQDLTPLQLTSKAKWTGEIILAILEELEGQLGKIKYAVGDYGSDIKKGLELAGIVHIHDVTHRMGIIVEKIYKLDASFENLTKRMSEMRIKLAQTTSASIIPPKQRKKSRYLNIDPISNWATKALRLAENKAFVKKNPDIYENLEWLKKYKKPIKELADINSVIKQIEKILKNRSFTEQSKELCEEKMKTLSGIKGEILKSKIREYFNSIKELLPKTKAILNSSDIIESTFGKYKNYLSSNPLACITNLSLCIAAFTSNLKKEDIKQALETVFIKDIDKWTKENIGESLFKKRKILLSDG
jgi:hypothetical protein